MTTRIRTALVYLLGIATVLVPAAAAFHAGILTVGRPHAEVPDSSSVDWGSVSAQDLTVAALFVTARDAGLRTAMDSLRQVVARERRRPAEAHQLAHGIGRFVMRRTGDPSIFGECTAEFSSGCYHGVMEGYLSGATPDSIQGVERLCRSVAESGQPRYALLECAHGMGHALMGVHGGSVPAALRGCDGMPTADERYRCWEGVYMEDLVRAIGVQKVDVADHHGHHEAARATGECGSAEPTHRAACWAYQSVRLLDEAGGDVVTALRGCRRAPDAASRSSCQAGFGKQTAGRLPARPDVIAAACAGDGPGVEAICLDGAVEYYVEQGWTVAPALQFCAVLSDSVRATCFTSLGARLPLMMTTDSAAVVCDQLERRFVEPCRRGLAQPRTS